MQNLGLAGFQRVTIKRAQTQHDQLPDGQKRHPIRALSVNQSLMPPARQWRGDRPIKRRQQTALRPSGKFRYSFQAGTASSIRR
jgi:hypothetical protein